MGNDMTPDDNDRATALAAPFIRRVGDVIQGVAVLAIIALATTVIGLRESVVALGEQQRAEIKRSDELRNTYVRQFEERWSAQVKLNDQIVERMTTGGCSAARCRSIEEALDRLATRLANAEDRVTENTRVLSVSMEKRIRLESDVTRMRDQIDAMQGRASNGVIGDTPMERGKR